MQWFLQHFLIAVFSCLYILLLLPLHPTVFTYTTDDRNIQQGTGQHSVIYNVTYYHLSQMLTFQLRVIIRTMKDLGAQKLQLHPQAH